MHGHLSAKIHFHIHIAELYFFHFFISYLHLTER